MEPWSTQPRCTTHLPHHIGQCAALRHGRRWAQSCQLACIDRFDQTALKVTSSSSAMHAVCRLCTVLLTHSVSLQTGLRSARKFMSNFHIRVHLLTSTKWCMACTGVRIWDWQQNVLCHAPHIAYACTTFFSHDRVATCRGPQESRRNTA